MKEQKRVLRRELTECRRAMSEKERQAADRAVAERFLLLSEYKNADILLLYASYGEEIDTYNIASAAKRDGKRVAYPRVLADRTMKFFFCDPSELLPGFRGIPEPSESAELWSGEENTVCVVPALAIDKKGFRLGYGGGFYDRFLSEFHPRTVGLVRSAFFAQSVPHEDFDIPVNITVTEKEVIYNED